MNTFSDEIQKARMAYASVKSHLADSPILLSATHSYANPLCHELHVPEAIKHQAALAKLDKMIGTQKEIPKTQKACTASEAAVSYYKKMRNRIAVADVSQEAYEWFLFRHHDLLMNLLKRGTTPEYWEEHCEQPGVTTPQSLHITLQHAKNNGYKVPPQYLQRDLKTSHGEHEAFYVAREYASGRIAHTNLSSEDHELLSDSILQVSSSFAIPNRYPGYAPFVADQLWIVRGPKNTLRFLVLEIDGEHHIEEQRAQKDRERDAHFNSLGYEVYRVAGWWARIDPFRVIGEFLQHALGAHSFKHAYLFAPHTIKEYVCDLCGKPMRRFDTDSIASETDIDDLEIAEEAGREPRKINYHVECHPY